MIRQPEREQLNRLTAKTLDQVFVMRVKEGLGCSQFEAEALTDLVKEVYFPWLAKPEAIQAGQRGVDLMPITKDFYRGIFRLEDLARIYTMVEEYDKALEILDRLLSKPGLISVNLLKKDPAWEKLWDLPAFSMMLDKHNNLQ